MTTRGLRTACSLAGSLLILAGCADDPGAGPGAAPGSEHRTSEPAATTSPTTTRVPSPPPTLAPRSITLVATGDVLPHERLWTQAQRDAHPDGTWNFAPQLAGIAPLVSGADLAICHLETPLAASAATAEGYPTFAAPPEIVPALAGAGYDACTTASNHTFDQGAAGVDRTLAALDAAGIRHAGSARTPHEDATPVLIEVASSSGGRPVTVGLISYTYGFNGIPYPDGEVWRSNVIDHQAVLADAAEARAAGAEVVVAALHWGTEYDQQPNADQLALAPVLLASPDIDLLLGHHAHVVQPVENIGGEWIVYGMGNLMANHAEPQGAKSEGLLVRFTFTEDRGSGRFAATAAEYLPLYQTYEPPVEVLDVPMSLTTGDTGSAGVERLRTALQRTTAVVESRGAAENGLALLSR